MADETYSTLISPADLRERLLDDDWAFVDCRFDLSEPERGRRLYELNHIPGAVYADLDRDLSAPIRPGRTGRHPLPNPMQFARTLSDWGIDADVQVVTYDDSGGAIAARVWWMLRWLGHERVAVLDGGWRHWQRRGFPMKPGAERRSPRSFQAQVDPEATADAKLVNRFRADATARLIDARAAERFRGEREPLDSVSGHIPGAVSFPFQTNLGKNGLFLAPDELSERYRDVIGTVPAKRVVCYCGSGVTAAHTVLAMTHAGLGQPRLYPGSWSEWITDPRRPVARG